MERARYSATRPVELLGYVLWLGRYEEVISVTKAVQQLISQDAFVTEVFQTEILLLGAYAAHLSGQKDVLRNLLKHWNSAHLGWRSRTKTLALAKFYFAMGSMKDHVMQGEVESYGSSKLCRNWVTLATDHLILLYHLAGEEFLRNANITESVILEKIEVYRPLLDQFLGNDFGGK